MVIFHFQKGRNYYLDILLDNLVVFERQRKNYGVIYIIMVFSILHNANIYCNYYTTMSTGIAYFSQSYNRLICRHL